MQLNDFLDADDDGIFYIGHASILIKLNGTTILCDPSGYDDPYLASWFYYPPQKKNKRLYSVDYVFISHVHKDHYDLGFLRHLSPNTKIIIMEKRETFERELDSENIKYQTIKSEIPTELSPGVFIHGFINTENNIDSSAVFYNNNMHVYHGNDHWLDIEKIKIFPKIDIACVPFAYIAWYPFCLKNISDQEKSAETLRLTKGCMDYGIDFIKEIKPKIFVPFGSNLVHFSSAFSEINSAVKCPLEFYEYAEKNNCSDCVEPLHAGDSIVCNKGFRINKEKISTKDYREKMENYIEQCNYLAQKSFNFNDKKYDYISEEDFIKILRTRIKNFPKTDQYIRIESYCGKRKLQINTLEKTVFFVKNWSKNYHAVHHFLLDEVASRAYFSGKKIFDDIAGTRRFSLERYPNDYCRETFFFSMSL